jgi:membrane-bound serine protease (ClpP class)
MKSRLAITLFIALVAFLVSAQASGATGTVPSIELSGEISPATSGWIGSALDDAAGQDAPLAIIRLDTPGGTDDSMREIVKDILAAPMPVVVYVSPDGARAGSAGVFVTEAADVAAMAPETNIGSASPITSTGADIGETLGRKITNDASAYVRTLATAHGRNPDLAEQMVREATNVTATEALDAGLIDVIATDSDDLLAQLDGFEAQGPKESTLDTDGLTIDEQDMPLQYEVLQILVDPNVVFLLLLIGMVGIALEVFSPGGVVPGVVGVLALLLGAVGAAQLPVEAIGVFLLVLGFVLIVAEAHLPTAGVLGVAGVGALIAGGLFLFDPDNGGPEVSPALVIVVGVVLGGLMVVAGQKVLAARRRPVRTGEEELIGSVGQVRAALDPIGQVFVAGALWRARVADPEDPVEAGYRVRIEAIDGLTLSVSPLGDEPGGVSTEAPGKPMEGT